MSFGHHELRMHETYPTTFAGGAHRASGSFSSGLFTKSAPTAQGNFGPREAWMVKASERDVSAVAASSGSERIHKSAVVESLRVATRLLDPAMAAGVQSAALSLLHADAKGCVGREEVARVWLTNVLPALERAPLRTSTGVLSTRRLTDRLQKILGGRLSQVILDELPNTQQSLGLSTDPTGGGALPPALVQPLVATLTAAALRATVRELGDALLVLPGLGGATGEADGELLGNESLSQADAVGAAEAFVRRMLEGALHGHHASLNETSSTGAASVDSGADDSAPAAGNAREQLLRRETHAELQKLRDAFAVLEADHRTLMTEHEALLSAHRRVSTELESAHASLSELRDAHAALDGEREAILEEQDTLSNEASALERELHVTRTARELEAEATKAAHRRCDELLNEKQSLENEVDVLLGRVAAAEQAAAAVQDVATAADSERGTGACADAPPLSPRCSSPRCASPRCASPRSLSSPSQVRLGGASSSAARLSSPARMPTAEGARDEAMTRRELDVQRTDEMRLRVTTHPPSPGAAGLRSPRGNGSPRPPLSMITEERAARAEAISPRRAAARDPSMDYPGVTYISSEEVRM